MCVRGYLSGCGVWRCLIRHISLCHFPSLPLSICLDVVQKQLEGVKGQGPGEGVTSQETAQLKLGLRLAFTVKIVNLSSPHRPLRKHMLCLSASVSFSQTLVYHTRANTLRHEGPLTHMSKHLLGKQLLSNTRISTEQNKSCQGAYFQDN